ncbi:cytochrome C [Sulfurimonas sp.]|uniref:cytochrome C n=1 Tax=Sulfurimonas sp. TaxID=2022749 RepID=UPI003D0B2465
MASYKKIAITALLGLGLFATTASADAAKGQRIYQKKLKATCHMTGAVFAAKHTQDEWAEFKDNGELVTEMTNICPAGKEFFESSKFESKFSSHLYDFVHDFASDSGNIPAC